MIRKTHSYVVYRKSDSALVAQGTAAQCATALGICLSTFYRHSWNKIGGRDAYEVLIEPCNPALPQHKRQMVYSIFHARTNDVIVTGTAEQCAEALGIKVSSFRSLLSRISAGTYHKYDYQREGYHNVE